LVIVENAIIIYLRTSPESFDSIAEHAIHAHGKHALSNAVNQRRNDFIWKFATDALMTMPLEEMKRDITCVHGPSKGQRQHTRTIQAGMLQVICDDQRPIAPGFAKGYLIKLGENCCLRIFSGIEFVFLQY
jgi:hypothetical protein